MGEITIAINEQCDRCGDSLSLKTKAKQCAGDDECPLDDGDDGRCEWHAAEGDQAICMGCGLIHHVNVDSDGRGWFSAGDWEDEPECHHCAHDRDDHSGEGGACTASVPSFDCHATCDCPRYRIAIEDKWESAKAAADHPAAGAVRSTERDIAGRQFILRGDTMCVAIPDARLEDASDPAKVVISAAATLAAREAIAGGFVR